MSARRLAAALALALAACTTDRITGVVELGVLDADAWSGGTLILRLPGFRCCAELPVVLAGNDTLGIRAFPADSVLVQLPDTNGPVDLGLRLGAGGQLVFASLRIHGFESAYDGPPVDGPMVPWPGGGSPRAIAIHAGRLLAVDFSQRAATPLTSDTGLNRFSCLYGGPTPSVEPGLVVVTRGSGFCGPAYAVPFIGNAPIDTGPPVFTYPSAHLGGDRWVVNHKHFYNVVTGSPTLGFTFGADIPGYAPDGYVVSPKRDRVVPIGGYGPQVPVFDTVSMAPVYTLPQTTGGAAFNDAGDTLFVVSGSDLLIVDAAGGAILATAPVHVFGYTGVGLDPVRPFIYVAGQSAGRPLVEVFERPTLHLVAVLRLPASIPLASYDVDYGDYYVLLSSGEPHLYVVIDSWYETRVLRFNVMPWTSAASARAAPQLAAPGPLP